MVFICSKCDVHFNWSYYKIYCGAKETLVNEDTQTNPVFYQDIQVVENPDSLSVLVNKNYSLPEDYNHKISFY